MTENMENTMFSLFYCIIVVTLTRCRHEKYTSFFFILVQGKICFTSLYHDQFNKDLNRNKNHIMR